MKRKKVLIIKLGHSETLCPEISRTCSLGDVLRSTVILNYLKEHEVTWLVDEMAIPLLLDNPHINRILPWNFETSLQLCHEHFDWVINLEKGAGICALVEGMNVWQRSGFRFNHTTGTADAHVDTERILALTLNKKDNHKVWQEYLAQLIRKKWKHNHRYIIPKRRVACENKIGLNFKVGTKWANKGWPIGHWHELAQVLENKKYKVSWQEGFDSLNKYMDWVASCSYIITTDSLGLHLALGFGKRVIGIFGPSPWKEVYMYGLGEIITPPSQIKCAPCFMDSCERNNECMYNISPSKVLKKVEELWPRK
jgi:heptosyltransferase II